MPRGEVRRLTAEDRVRLRRSFRERTMNPAREQPTIGEIAKSRVFDDKVLLAPSLRAGQQWIEKTVRDGTDVLNLRVATPIGLALELAGPVMSALDATLLARGVGPLLIESIWPVVE